MFRLNKCFLVLLTVTVLAFVSSCRKQPGDGGLGSIHGKVYGYDTNNFGIATDSGYLADARVFLAYGDNTWVDDDTRTSYTGEYYFPYLHPGDYSVWVITECDTCVLNQSADIERVTIDDPRGTVEVRDLKMNY
ncbi:MAG TPA: hypothetical protein VK174_16505 [Chitinophagales bacterium]|nr:hypothetical protein [Chitinophagales bacterium]